MITTSICVDKLCMRYMYDNSQESALEYKQLSEFKYSVLDGSLGSKGKVWKPKSGAITCMALPMEGMTLYVRFGFVHGRYWSWIEVNPSRLNFNNGYHLRACLDLLFTYGATTLWHKARLSRVDFAIDAKPAKFQDYLFLDRRLSSSHHQLDLKGTTYLGALGGARSYCAYDKAKQLHEVEGLTVNESRLRLEARIRKPGEHAFNTLFSVPNPFQSLMVVDRKVFLAGGATGLQSLRKRVATGEPLDCIYRQMPAQTKKGVWEQLQESKPSWWEPANIWKDLGGAMGWLQALLPSQQSTAAA